LCILFIIEISKKENLYIYLDILCNRMILIHLNKTFGIILKTYDKVFFFYYYTGSILQRNIKAKILRRGLLIRTIIEYIYMFSLNIIHNYIS
jgi:hypothetical protein